ncbi:MAG TPA: hypothetical protein VGB64_01865 [Actinomycetota bacterium]
MLAARPLIAAGAALFAIASAVAVAVPVPAIPIPQSSSSVAAPFIGTPATPDPLASFAVPQHPFMAPDGRSNLHNDAYQTDAYNGAGPLGINPRIRSTFHVAECASVTFDSAGRIITICVGFDGPRLMMIDPDDLSTLAAFPLPPRNPSTLANVFSSFSGGGYFYLDHLGRAVIPTNDGRILVVGVRETAAGPSFMLETVHDLSGHVSSGDGIVSVLPDWSGLLWFVTESGVVGTAVDSAPLGVRSIDLTGEAIANSFAVDETGGVYVVSDHALYRFDAAADGTPVATWREPYDRGTRRKPGQVSQGSGTTPTLIGGGYVAITDNADPKMNVIVYRRSASVAGSRFVCAAGVFADGVSNTDQSLIAVGNALIAENNYGYSGPLATNGGGVTEPGLARVDFDAGASSCTVVWTSAERAPSVVPKVSLANGLIYTYTKDPQPDSTDAWYFTAIDFRTGATVYKIRAGLGLGFNNNYAPVTLGPDGTAYVGVLGGLAAISDTP